MENLTTMSVLNPDEAKRKAYSLNINNGEICSITDGYARTRYFEMKRGVLSEILNPSTL